MQNVHIKKNSPSPGYCLELYYASGFLLDPFRFMNLVEILPPLLAVCVTPSTIFI